MGYREKEEDDLLTGYYDRVVNAPIHGTLPVWGTERDWRKKRARAAWEHIGNAERMSKWNVWRGKVHNILVEDPENSRFNRWMMELEIHEIELWLGRKGKGKDGKKNFESGINWNRWNLWVLKYAKFDAFLRVSVTVDGKKKDVVDYSRVSMNCIQ